MSTPAFDRALALADKLNGAGIVATVDPRSATPPCVLVTPPGKTYDIVCGFTAAWSLWVLVPGTGNAEAFAQLDRIETAVAGVLPVSRSTFSQYVLSPDNPPMPAYHLEFSEGV